MTTWTDLTHVAERTFGIVTRDQLLDAGLSDRTIDRWASDGRLVPVARGVFRIGGVPPSFEAAVVAAMKVFEGDTWASHHTAARLEKLGLHGRETRIELTRPVELSAQRSIARVHRTTSLPPHHLTVITGIPVTSVSRTIFDLARTTGPARLGRAIDVGLLERSCTMGSLYRVLWDLGGRGRPGTRRMREVLDVRGLDHVPPESELEEVGMALLDGLGLEWQVEMSDERGYIRRVDGRHPSGRLIVELDGKHHDLESQKLLDRAGDHRLEAMGWDVVRLRWRHVTREGEATRAAVAARLRAAVA
ncbi:MAG TPA: type IV toxin-antitoxin system AbiEi family antitoxin domain-containing protein [Iamia sp.]|nr:type IV toxin-antitoxin system AbiEi family antitoxin domain-containing protein [Iamia sp.]